MTCSYVCRFSVTLLEATGCKQVCPPAVKLQKTLKASEVQPKFGSIQNQPERPEFKERTDRVRQRDNKNSTHANTPIRFNFCNNKKIIFWKFSRHFTDSHHLWGFDDSRADLCRREPGSPACPEAFWCSQSHCLNNEESWVSQYSGLAGPSLCSGNSGEEWER